MIYIKFTHVDFVTRVPVTSAPASNGPDIPAVDGLKVGFALESEYPTEAPTLYGMCHPEADVDVPGVLEVVTPDAYEKAWETEQAARTSAEVERNTARKRILSEEARSTRDKLLASLDKVTIRHRDQVGGGLPTTLTAGQYMEVLLLKQRLRDVTEQETFPENILWPDLPDYLTGHAADDNQLSLELT